VDYAKVGAYYVVSVKGVIVGLGDREVSWH
jgi:hypothetical protein